MEITREKIVALWNLFDRMSREKMKVRIAYLILKNKRLLEPEVKSLEEARQPNEEMQEYEKKRVKLCQELGDKDDAGNPKVVMGRFSIPDDSKDEFEERIKKLQEENKETLEKDEEKEKEFLEMLKEEVDIDISKINISLIEEVDFLTQQEVELLFDFIEE